MVRKTAVDYKKEMYDLNNMVDLLRSRVIHRLYTLCVNHPEVPIASEANLERTVIKAKSLIPTNGSKEYIKGLDFEVLIKFIDVIEKHLAAQHPYKQTTIQF